MSEHAADSIPSLPATRPSFAPTAEDWAAALFNLVGGLAIRLTGKVPVVRVVDRHGNHMNLYPDQVDVRWFDTLREASRCRADSHPGSHGAPCAPPGVPGGTPLAPPPAEAP